MALLNFDANEVAPSTGFDPIPAGKYVAVINDSGEKENKAGTGSYLQLEFEIIEGNYKGRRLWVRLNLQNQNPDAVRMARADLSAICHAVNVLKPNDSVELHNIPLVITVRCKKDKNTDEIVNEVRGYESRDAAQNPQATPASTATANATVTAAPGAKPSWMR